MPRATVGVHALRNLPLLDITEDEFDAVVRRRKPDGMNDGTACAIMTLKAMTLGHRSWYAWSLIDTLSALGWTESEMVRKARAPFEAMEPIEPPF